MVRTIRIHNLTLEPFKGVKTSLFFNGDDAEIKGKYGTGKTTCKTLKTKKNEL